MDDEERKVLGAAATAVAEAGADIVLGAVGVALAGPIAAIGLPLARKALSPLIRGHVSQRTEARKQAYEEAFVNALMKSDLTFEEFASLDEAGAEKVFQAYRRAVDAYDPVVVPALGRLTAIALRDGKDRFFVGVGRVLEQMTVGEFQAFHGFVDAAHSICWHDATEVVAAYQSRTEVRVASDSKSMQPHTLPASEDLISVLGLLGRHRIALTPAEDPTHGNLGGTYLVSLTPPTLRRLRGLFE